MNLWKDCFPNSKPVIGMIHLQALPGTPAHRLSMAAITNAAVSEAKLYQDNGLDAVMLENMHDLPYLNRKVGPEIISAMTAVACAVKAAVDIPAGIQILAGANREALAVALAAGLQFIRAEGFVFGHLADEGYMDSCAGELLRYRKQIGAERIAVLTDIKKKHSAHALTADVTIGETAVAAEFFLSDGLIVTGNATGQPASLSDLQEVRRHSALPVLIGSGINSDNLEQFFPYADGFIIGSHFKEDGKWFNPLSQIRIKDFMQLYKTLL
jgi:membrane complex biogenesis BtpA family protein